ncbi:hypothetical protein C8R45DRAFT_1105213 [Mycena sanguinolenta]|nr:hypothetical protein C8R45DRAFT_1105213 [Mycena sanguinolenta]
MHEVFQGYTWLYLVLYRFVVVARAFHRSSGEYSVVLLPRKCRTANAIARTFPHISPDPSGDQYEAYCRTKVLLHHSFQNLEGAQQIDGQERTWAEIWAACRAADHIHPRDTLCCWEKENRNVQEEEDDDEDVPDAATPPNDEDWQIFAQAFPNAPIHQVESGDLGTRPMDDTWDLEAAHDGRWANIELMRSYIDEVKKEATAAIADQNAKRIDVATLAPKQHEIWDFIRATYMDTLGGNPEQQLFQVDGSAGYGKTYLIHAICQELRDIGGDRDELDHVRVLAPSGAAALNINGKPIHSALGLPVNSDFLPLTGALLARL